MRVTHGASHRGCLRSAESLFLLTNAMEKENMTQASDLPPCQLPGRLRKDDSSEVARGRQTQVPGTYGGWGLELIGRYHIDVG